jgi:predicted secreted Zn-dependent protease
MNGINIIALLFALLLACATPSSAAEASRTVYYPVKGRTAPDIYASIRSASPRVEKGATFAFTRIATKTDSKLGKANAQCRYVSFRTAGYFIFTLPQHVAPDQLPAKLRSKWLSFVDYLLVHEQGHRDMWQQCFADYDAAVLQLSAGDCRELDALREKLFTDIKRRCIAKDEAFDVIFRKEVLREPFMKDALRKKQGKEN